MLHSPFWKSHSNVIVTVKMTHLSSFCCVSPECIPVTQPESQRPWNYSTGNNNENLIGSSFIALLIFILKRVVASVSTDSWQAGTVNSTDRERLQSRSQVIGDSVCVSVFCLHIKLLTRKTAFSECFVYCTNRCIACSIRCSPSSIIPPFLPALPLPPIAPTSLGPLAPPLRASHMPFSAVGTKVLWAVYFSSAGCFLSDMATSSLIFPVT